MKKILISFLLTTVFLSNCNADGMDQFQQETNAIWSPGGDGTKDTSQDAQINTSMLAWGVGLAVVIGIAFGLIKSYNNTASTTQ